VISEKRFSVPYRRACHGQDTFFAGFRDQDPHGKSIFFLSGSSCIPEGAFLSGDFGREKCWDPKYGDRSASGERQRANASAALPLSGKVSHLARGTAQFRDLCVELVWAVYLQHSMRIPQMWSGLPRHIPLAAHDWGKCSYLRAKPAHIPPKTARRGC